MNSTVVRVTPPLSHHPVITADQGWPTSVITVTQVSHHLGPGVHDLSHHWPTSVITQSSPLRVNFNVRLATVWHTAVSRTPRDSGCSFVTPPTTQGPTRSESHGLLDRIMHELWVSNNIHILHDHPVKVPFSSVGYASNILCIITIISYIVKDRADSGFAYCKCSNISNMLNCTLLYKIRDTCVQHVDTVMQV